MGALGFVFAVTLVTWLGIFAYLLFIDRSLRRLETETAARNEENDL